MWRERVTVSFPFTFFGYAHFVPPTRSQHKMTKVASKNGKLFMLILHSLRGERTGWNDVLSYEITLLGVVLASFCQQDIIQKKRNLSLLQKSPITYGRKEAKPLLIRALEPFYAVPKANMQCDEHVWANCIERPSCALEAGSRRAFESRFEWSRLPKSLSKRIEIMRVCGYTRSASQWQMRWILPAVLHATYPDAERNFEPIRVRFDCVLKDWSLWWSCRWKSLTFSSSTCTSRSFALSLRTLDKDWVNKINPPTDCQVSVLENGANGVAQRRK